jgi:hypothetical protein
MRIGFMIRGGLLLIRRSFWNLFIDLRRKDPNMSRLNSFRKSGICKNYNRRNSNYYNWSRNLEDYKNGQNPMKTGKDWDK